MKKIIIFLLIILFIFPLVSAINLEVEKLSSGEVMIIGLTKSAVFDLKITNFGQDDNLKFYNLVGFRIFPLGTTPIKAGETKEIQLEVTPIGEFKHEGPYAFRYFIRSQDDSEIGQTLTFKRIKLKDAFEVGSGSFDPESSSIELFIANKENFDFGEAKAEFSSAFFNVGETFTIGPRERKNFTIELNKEDFQQLLAGFYTSGIEIQVEEEKAEFQTTLKFLEKNIVTSSEIDYGFIIATKIMKKTNKGNTLADTQINIKKNIISRLFTTFNPEPGIVERKGLGVDYTWNKEVKPGETFEVSIKTNHLFPLIIILLIITIVILTKQYTKTNLVLKKKVNFVRAKGGEFALKVTIFINAKKYIEKINVIDKLPPLVKVYEKFGREEPSRIDHKNKRIEWNFQKLEEGESRIISYIIYSKVGVLGKFALPAAKAIYEKEGEVRETISNRAFFIAEQKYRKEEE